jgi:hypothetical protein
VNDRDAVPRVGARLLTKKSTTKAMDIAIDVLGPMLWIIGRAKDVGAAPTRLSEFVGRKG